MENKKKTIKKVLDVASYVAVFLFFIMALVSCILKFSGVKFNVFGSRYDVVLTDSMSSKNEKYKAFLEGHDDQFDAFDVVKSEKVENQSDIKLYDVVLYDDPKIGLNMHRIVNIVEDGKDIISARSSTIKTIGNYTGISFNDITSRFKSEFMQFDEIEMTVLSLEDGDGNLFDFNCSGTNLSPVITKTNENGSFIFTYKVINTEKAPGYMYITYKNIHNYDNDLIINLKVNASSGLIDAKASDFTQSGDELVGEFNHSFRFETRGDKADTSDGMISFSKIEGRVVKRIPKLGYFLRFMESIWGSIMFILLGFLILGSAILRDYLDKKEAMKTANEAPNVEDIKDPVETAEKQKEVVSEPTPIVEELKEESKVEEPKPGEQSTELKPKSDNKEAIEKKMAELKAAQVATEKAEEAARKAEARARAAKEGINNTKPEQPARVNGRFVSKNPAKNPAKPASNSSRWTKDNNPSVNKKRAEGGK